MPSSFDFMPSQQPLNPQYQQMSGQPTNFYNPEPMQTQVQYNTPSRPPIVPLTVEPPEIEVSKGLFSVKSDDDAPDTKLSLVSPDTLSDEQIAAKKHRQRKKKEEVGTVNSNEIIRAEGTVEDTTAMYNYIETTNMTRQTIAQLDMLASEVKNEIDFIRNNKTLKRKYDYMSNLSSTLGSILGTKLTAIREINNSITKASEMDYKRDKDRKAQDNMQNDDKYIMDMYNAFISNAGGASSILGPNAVSAALPGTGIVRAPIDQQNAENNLADAGYLNYVSNMTPTQKMMYMEHDPNIKQVVVFDAATGNKFFQVMNMATGQVVTGVPVRDQMFMEDTTIDIRNKIAKNVNLNETYPLVIINENIANEY